MGGEMENEMKMEMQIRQEQTKDHAEVEALVEEAFREMEMSDHKEQFLVARLRKSAAFVPELSLVAEGEGKLLGHILLTRIQIREGERSVESLALAPVSVRPAFQGQGIGAALIEEAHRIAEGLGFGSTVLLGHPAYYPRFGYVRASAFGIRLPFEVPDEACMAIELVPGSLKGAGGTVVYPKEFFEEA